MSGTGLTSGRESMAPRPAQQFEKWGLGPEVCWREKIWRETKIQGRRCRVEPLANQNTGDTRRFGDGVIIGSCRGRVWTSLRHAWHCFGKENGTQLAGSCASPHLCQRHMAVASREATIKARATNTDTGDPAVNQPVVSGISAPVNGPPGPKKKCRLQTPSKVYCTGLFTREPGTLGQIEWMLQGARYKQENWVLPGTETRAALAFSVD